MKSYRIAAIPGDGIGREVVPEGLRCLRAAADAHEFALEVEELGDPLPQDLDLLLLQRDGGDLHTRARLEEERALPGLADGARHEAFGRVEAMDDRHVPSLDAS